MIVNDLLPRLNTLQHQFGYLPLAELEQLARDTGLDMAAITSAATFYSGFRTRPAGKHQIRVCVGAACHVKGAEEVYDAFRRELAIDEPENDTDAAGRFTVSKVACLGCCMLAVAVQIDEHIFGWVTANTVPEVIQDFLLTQHETEKTGKSSLDMAAPAQTMPEFRLCRCSSCRAAGAEQVWQKLTMESRRYAMPIVIREVSCTGKSYCAPEVVVADAGKQFHYPRVKPELTAQLLREHGAATGTLGKMRWQTDAMIDAIYGSNCQCQANNKNHSQNQSNLQIATERAGESSPLDWEDYCRGGGSQAMQLVSQSPPEETLHQLNLAGLRGRGGAGFPVSRKWRLAMEAAGDVKVVVCNADEGDPGAFMDRMILESFPFRVLEGMLIAARVISARAAIIYIREEYQLAIKILRQAIEICRQNGFFKQLGNDFQIILFRGAGAFVCGEETALLESLEGRRGAPRRRPPFPTSAGLFGRPTLINNVETFACIPWILRHGGSSFAALGTAASPGSKAFALAGKVKRGGLIEVPMGTTIADIVNHIGGGSESAHALKSVLIGGPSGGCLPVELFSLPVDYEALTTHGAMMGSGGLVVLDQRDCMIDLAAYFLDFTSSESCGQCTLCREGLQHLRQMTLALTQRQQTPLPTSHLEELRLLAEHIRLGSLCGLGRTAPNMVLSAMRHFADEFIEHLHGHCSAGKCRELGRFEVTDACIGCTKCAQHCAAGAIAFTPLQKHHIDQDVCVRCGVCRDVCPQQAISSHSDNAAERPAKNLADHDKTRESLAQALSTAATAAGNLPSPVAFDAGISATSSMLWVDGQAIPWQPNQTILQLAVSVDIPIPTLCHLPGCQEKARCLVCSVFDCKQGLFVPACATLAESGRQYENLSERVTSFRRRALSLLLDRHDLRCSQCAKQQTCILRLLMRTFKARKTTANPKTTKCVSTTEIDFFPDRCVLCGRCVALSEKLGAGLCFQGRGAQTYVAPPWGQDWEQATRQIASELINVCPVGALCHHR